MKSKKFDCVQMTRDIRDFLYEQNRNIPLNEFADAISKEARKSSLWKKLKLDAKSKQNHEKSDLKNNKEEINHLIN